MNRKQVFFSNLPVLETARLRLRPFQLEDAPDLFSYASSALVSRFLPWEAHRTLSDSEEFVSFILKQYEEGRPAPWAVELKETGNVIGTIDFVAWFPEHRRAELGFVLSEEYWGRGLIAEAARRVIAYGFDYLDLVKIKAPAITENVQSRRVLEKLGFKLEGILKQEYIIKGKSRDMAVYSLIKEQERSS
ncbi:GNAT family N-acetyltransferase [Alteribacter natronophilus]|uniref:GNAT family N-acetyltransferase n=1 Tax=Alteribacter natronophilus TaxID=2583810 RepID=UPI00110E4936|nr:GNAT family protein [Alteribacter natronophilus]TMW71872.1 GNAT family N-acetyltransferase [Alteribacter natronophilus]